MSNFTPYVDYQVEFEGDTITMKLRRLKRQAIQSLMPHMNVDEDGNAKMTFESQAKFSEVTIGFLPDYVKDFQGLKDAEGNDITFKDMMQEAYFNTVTGEIIAKLFEISKMAEDQIKN